MRSCLSR